MLKSSNVIPLKRNGSRKNQIPYDVRMQNAAEIIRFIIPGIAFLQKEAATQGLSEVAGILDKTLDDICAFILTNIQTENAQEDGEGNLLDNEENLQSIKNFILLLGKIKNVDALNQFLATIDLNNTSSSH